LLLLFKLLLIVKNIIFSLTVNNF